MLEFIADSAGTMKEAGSPCPSKIKRAFVKGDFTQKMKSPDKQKIIKLRPGNILLRHRHL